jgi:serine/threonine-protein kinase RsbW
VNDRSVTITIPASADHVSLLRALVGMYAAREDFTLEEVDDLRMAVEEAAVQMLRRASGPDLQMIVRNEGKTVYARLSAQVASDEPIMDPASFSWTILSALSDAVAVDTVDGTGVVELSRVRGTEVAS